MRGRAGRLAWRLGLAGLGLTALAASAHAADLSGVLPIKAPPPAAPVAYDWAGFYLGAHVGYGLGGSNWSATQAGAATPSLSGTLSFSNAYNFSSGTGSYLLGFQAGYDYMAASHWLVGVATDISIPSFPRRQPDHLVTADRHGELSGRGRAVRQRARPCRLCAKS